MAIERNETMHLILQITPIQAKDFPVILSSNWVLKFYYSNTRLNYKM